MLTPLPWREPWEVAAQAGHLFLGDGEDAHLVALDDPTKVLPPGEGIGADELQDVLDAQGVEVREGDALLVRTGLLGATRVSGRWSEFAQCGPNLPNTPGIAVGCLPLRFTKPVSGFTISTSRAEKCPGDPINAP